MGNTFRIPLLNSFRWVNKNPNRDVRYNSEPFDDKVDQYNPNGAYFAKWQTNDKAQIQLLSDYVPTLRFYDFCSNQLYLEVPIETIETQILDVSFLCYQAEVDFSDFDEGNYYGEITYNDGTSDQVWQTCPLNIAAIQPETLLYEYKNSVNDKDVVFDTGIEFNFRVEGLIRSYLPKSENELYTDQEYNIAQENSTPFRNFTNVIGSARGIPDWVIDKMNLIFSVDTKKIDGVYYEKAEAGSNFEPTRPEIGLNEDGFWGIAIIPHDNFFLDKFTTGDEPIDTDYIVVAKSIPYLNQAANISIAGVFKNYSTLVALQITNKTFTAFTLKVGTTNGGAQIATLSVPSDVVSYHLINNPFNSIQTVYLTGITGNALSLDIWIRYDELDSKPSVPSGGGATGFPKGYMGMYHEVTDGDFEIHWDGVTGLGKTGSRYEGCAIMGTNGLPDASLMYPAIWDITQPSTRDTVVGADDNKINLTLAQLPENNFKFGYDRKGGNQGVDVLSSNFNGITGSTTKNIGGSGQDIDITPQSLVTLFFVKLTD